MSWSYFLKWQYGYKIYFFDVKPFQWNGQNYHKCWFCKFLYLYLNLGWHHVDKTTYPPHKMKFYKIEFYII